jgi:SAM-dependent methyltransferase
MWRSGLVRDKIEQKLGVSYMPSVEENKYQWSNYDWKDQGDEWSEAWGKTEYLWLRTIYPRIKRFIPTNSILEIAPGYGRITQYLNNYCRTLKIVDLNINCIEACKKRFKQSFLHRIDFYTNDGLSLPMIADKSIDFIFSWDSLVHAEPDTIESYIKEFARILKNDGKGFIHHSNIAEFPGAQNDHWRGNMSSELFVKFCLDADLHCLSQEKINWGSSVLNDCFSVFARQGDNKVVSNPNFMDEALQTRQIAELYS